MRALTCVRAFFWLFLYSFLLSAQSFFSARELQIRGWPVSFHISCSVFFCRHFLCQPVHRLIHLAIRRPPRVREQPTNFAFLALFSSVDSCQPVYYFSQFTISASLPCQPVYHVSQFTISASLPCKPVYRPIDDRLIGQVVKASRDPEIKSRLRRDFSVSSHTSDFKIGSPMATLPGASRYRVSAGTGWPGVSIL